jgi:hypothetical protein
MFKVGDTVECVHEMPGYYTKGKHYVVKTTVGNLIHTETCDTESLLTFGHKNRFKLVASQTIQPTYPAAPGTAPAPTPMYSFKKGDLVKCIRKEFMNETVGNIYTVDDDYNGQGTHFFYVEKDDNGRRNSYRFENFELATTINSPYSITRITSNEMKGTEKSIAKTHPMKPKSDCECGNASNPIGQGHSRWCKMFRQEF